MTTMTKEEKINIIAEKTKGQRTAMLVTMTENGSHHGRPMSTQEITEAGDIWFMTSKDSNKVKNIQMNPEVGLMYGDGNGTEFVSLSGTATLHTDKEKIKELWTDFYKAWFENQDDPTIVLIKVAVKSAEYWDYKGGKVGVLVDMAKAAVTGKQADGGINESFDL